MTGRIVAFGDLVDDIIVTTAAPLRIDTDVDADIAYASGGSGANIAAWLGHLGTEVDFIGRVGTGDGARHRAELEQFGVRAHIVEDAERPTSRIVSIVHGDSRTFLVMNGASALVGPASVADALLAAASIVLVTGHSIRNDERLGQFPSLLARAREQGAIVALDPSSAGFIGDLGAERFRDVVRGVDVLLPNRDEGRVLSGESDPERAALALTEIAETVVLTAGGDGAYVAIRGRGVEHVPPQIAALVDPTGAGDAFDAGVIAGLWRGEDAVTAARGAVQVAARAVASLGGRPTA